MNELLYCIGFVGFYFLIGWLLVAACVKAPSWWNRLQKWALHRTQNKVARIRREEVRRAA